MTETNEMADWQSATERAATRAGERARLITEAIGIEQQIIAARDRAAALEADRARITAEVQAIEEALRRGDPLETIDRGRIDAASGELMALHREIWEVATSLVRLCGDYAARLVEALQVTDEEVSARAATLMAERAARALTARWMN